MFQQNPNFLNLLQKNYYSIYIAMRPIHLNPFLFQFKNSSNMNNYFNIFLPLKLLPLEVQVKLFLSEIAKSELSNTKVEK